MNRRAQTTIEFAVLIGVLVAGLIAMQLYMKRSLQGRMRNDANQLSGGGAYSPAGLSRGLTVITTSVNEHTHLENKESVSTANIFTDVDKTEQTLPLAAEPQRY